MPKLSTRPFTDTYLHSLKPGNRRTDHYDAIVRGLGLRVATSGTKTWFVMKRIDGSNRRITIGRYPAIPLQDARKKAEALLADIAVGKPLANKPQLTFGTAVNDWFSREQATRRTVSDRRRSFENDILPLWKSRRLSALHKSDIRDLLDSFVDRGHPYKANRVLALLRRFFNWAVERDLLEASPVTGIKPPAPSISRERTLSRDELAAIWNATEAIDYPFGPYIRMLILTGQRRNEVAGAKWKEFDNATWTIPGERAKNGKSHLVHLSAEAVATLKAIPRREGCELVFTTTGTTPISGFSRAKTALDSASGVGDWRIHDLRRTFATLATGELGIEPAVVDKILNHSTGAVTGVARVYQRAQYLDKRKTAMERWGVFVASSALNDVDS